MASLKHNQLKTEARKMLKEKYGFSDSEIFEEFPYTFKNSIKIWIDVVGKSSSKIVVVECGDTSRLRLQNLKEELGKDNVIHMPYDKNILAPHFYMNPKTRKDKIILLKSVYNKFIFEKMKEDSDFEFFEYNEKNKDYFYIGKRRDIWMAFPSKKNTIDGKQLQYEIGFTIDYQDDDHYTICIGAETNNSVKQFLELSDKTKDSILEELKKLPSNFEIQDGIKYKTERVRMPPYLRNWEMTEPIQCNQISIDKLNEIEKRLRWYLEEGMKFEEYPVFAMVRVLVKKEELSKVLMILKPLYELSFKFRTQKQDRIEHDSLELMKKRVKLFELGFDTEMEEEDYERTINAIRDIEKK